MQVNEQFWGLVVDEETFHGSGGGEPAKISGWISRFFPYDKDKQKRTDLAEPLTHETVPDGRLGPRQHSTSHMHVPVTLVLQDCAQIYKWHGGKFGREAFDLWRDKLHIGMQCSILCNKWWTCFGVFDYSISFLFYFIFLKSVG